MNLVGTYSEQLYAADARFNYKKHIDRRYDLCIAAQWRGSEKTNEFWVGKGGNAERFFSTVAIAQNSDSAKDTYAAYVDVARRMNVDITDKLKHSQYMRLLYWHARKKERIELKDTDYHRKTKSVIQAFKTGKIPKPKCWFSSENLIFKHSQKQIISKSSIQ
jgi:hypothetical protein